MTTEKKDVMGDKTMNDKWLRIRRRAFEIIEVGNDLDYPSRAYDFVNAFAIVLNLVITIMQTFSEMQSQYGGTLLFLERITIVFFAIDYILRLWTARFLFPQMKERKAIKRYMLSFNGWVDLLSFLPDCLPVFFPSGTVAFRMIRIIRIFRLFRINAYYDSLSVITQVIVGKKQQLISSVFIILILMIASSLCMYSLEHEAQPEVFSNAFSGIWWAASTLLTVGYGDIYPVTIMGKLFGIIITFLGVGMVAIPTGIISAGFVDQYTSIKKRDKIGYQLDMHFIKIRLEQDDKWVGKKLSQIDLPKGVIVAIIKRDEKHLVPRGNVILRAEDKLVLGALPFEDHENIKLQEFVLEDHNPWTGAKIKDLDISRHSIIVLVKRGEKSIIPYGNLVLQDEDQIFLYTHLHLPNATEIEL